MIWSQTPACRPRTAFLMCRTIAVRKTPAKPRSRPVVGKSLALSVRIARASFVAECLDVALPRRTVATCRSPLAAAIFETGPKATTTPVAPAVPRVFVFSMQAEQSIVVDPKSPGGINSPHGLILFDGICVLCSRGCRFVSKRDRRGYFRFVPIQLAEGRRACHGSSCD